MPASLMTDFCSGPVTMAWKRPDKQPSAAFCKAATRAEALAGFNAPGAAGAAKGTGST